jgi:zinc transport system substrate-binding protein|tara:strand:- start:13292 stop:13516 length:225 start_codon:yes stop_codon:yes gene_type:complete
MRKGPMKRFITKIVRGFGILLFASAAIPAASDEIHVIVSINPQKYFVQQIGGDRVHVTVMVYPGASPATYEPKP